MIKKINSTLLGASLFVAAFMLFSCSDVSESPDQVTQSNSTPNSSVLKGGSGPKAEPSKEPMSENSGIDSIYTDLAEDKCVDAEKEEQEEWSVQSCKGVAGYSLLVSEGDARQTIDVIAPNKEKYELDLWTVVSSGFSTVGDKAEWRVKKEGGKTVPFALIVRFNVNEHPNEPEKITSYLTVTKITADGACVTNVVSPIPKANEIARNLADASHPQPCKKDLS